MNISHSRTVMSRMRMLAAEEFSSASALRQRQLVLGISEGSRDRFLNSEQLVKIRGRILGEKHKR